MRFFIFKDNFYFFDGESGLKGWAIGSNNSSYNAESSLQLSIGLVALKSVTIYLPAGSTRLWSAGRGRCDSVTTLQAASLIRRIRCCVRQDRVEHFGGFNGMSGVPTCGGPRGRLEVYSRETVTLRIVFLFARFGGRKSCTTGIELRFCRACARKRNPTATASRCWGRRCAWSRRGRFSLSYAIRV